MLNQGQGSLEYLLLLGGAILVGVVIFVMAQGAVSEGKNILETNLGLSVDISQTSADNVFIPFTGIVEFTATGGDGKVILTYSAPGASSFILAVQKESNSFVTTLVNPSDFDGSFPSSTQKFALPFYENTAEYGAAVNGTIYYFRLRACDDAGTCIVSDVEDAVAGSP